MNAGLAVIDASDYCHKVLRDEAGGAEDGEITHSSNSDTSFNNTEKRLLNASKDVVLERF